MNEEPFSVIIDSRNLVFCPHIKEIKPSGNIDYRHEYFRYILVTFGESLTMIKDKFMEVLSDSKEYVFLTTFALGLDKDILEKLKKIIGMGARIYLVTVLDKRTKNIPFADDIDVGYVEEMKAKTEFRDSGIFIADRNNVHSKFYIFDGKVGIISTGNFTKTAFSGNIEIAVRLESHKQVDFLEKLFSYYFITANAFVLPDKPVEERNICSEFLKARDELIEKLNAYLEIKNRHGKFDIILTLEELKRFDIKEKIIKMISDINSEELLISTYLIRDEDHSLFVSPIAKRLSKNKKVKLFLPEEKITGGKTPTWETLHNLFLELYNVKAPINKVPDLIKVFLLPRNHAKVLFNYKEAIIVSANIDSKHGITSGNEIGVYTKDKNVLEDIKKLFKLFQSKTTKELILFVRRDKLANLIKDLLEKENIRENRDIALEIEYKKELKKEIEKVRLDLTRYPIYLIYSKSKKGDERLVRIRVDKFFEIIEFKIKKKGDKSLILEEIKGKEVNELKLDLEEKLEQEGGLIYAFLTHGKITFKIRTEKNQKAKTSRKK